MATKFYSDSNGLNIDGSYYDRGRFKITYNNYNNQDHVSVLDIDLNISLLRDVVVTELCDSNGIPYASGDEILASVGSLSGTVSRNNSSTQALGVNEIFTGEIEDVSNVAVIKVAIATNVSSAIDGLSIQYSMNGVNWDWSDKYTVVTGNEEITSSPSAQYFRIVYTNGSVAQNYMRLSVILKTSNIKPSTHRIKDSLTEQDDVTVSKTVLAYLDTNDGNVNNVSIQNPLPIDGDSVYSKDIWEDESSIGDFTGKITDLFDNLHTVIVNTTTNNPKTLLIHFNRTITSNVIGLGTFGGGNFSNVKIEIVNSGGVYTTVIDQSTRSTKYTSRIYQLPVTNGFNAIRITFKTADTITLSNVVILKTRSVVARLQATKNDDTVIDINATNNGNLKTSFEELESGISDDSNSKLKVSPYVLNEDGIITRVLGDTIFEGSPVTIDVEHHEIHCGDTYRCSRIVDVPNSGTDSILIIVPNDLISGKLFHLIMEGNSESEGEWELFEAPNATGGTTLTSHNANRNSLFADVLTITHTPTITTNGTLIDSFHGGAGKGVGSSGRSDEWVLKNNTKYLARFTNSTTTPNYITWKFKYYVHPGV